MKSARLIVTTDCNRDCEYCCNEHQTTKDAMRELDRISDLHEYDEIMITGGEPTLLNIGRLTHIMSRCWSLAKDTKFYLWTASFEWDWLTPLLDGEWIEGFTYTLHDNADYADLDMYAELCDTMEGYDVKARLVVSSNIADEICIKPALWERITFINEWKDDGDCHFPEDALYVITPNTKGLQYGI